MSAKKFKIESDFSRSARLKRWVFLLLPRRVSVFLFRKFIDGNRERNKLEAAKFLVDANKIYTSKYNFLLPKFLKFALDLGDTALPRGFVNVFAESLKQTRKNPSLRSAKCQEMIEQTKALQREITSAQSWKLVSLALSGFGFIRAGTIARNYCLEAAIAEVETGKFSNRTLHLAIRGLLEIRRFNEACDVIENHTSELDSNSTQKIYGDYLALLKQPRPKVPFDKAIDDSPEENLFRELITKKSVAVVATGEIRTISGTEIDAHDTVARVKFQGPQFLQPADYAGTRCDVSLYTEDLVNKFDRKSFNNYSYFDFLSAVKLVVLKERLQTAVGKTPVKYLDTRAPTTLTTATSGTLFIFDILRAWPKKIFLVGFNFYTDSHVYNSGLLNLFQNTDELKEIGLPTNWFDLTTEQKTSSNIACGFTAHDPKSDFLLVKNLYELSGLIDGTPEVLAILNLTADEYDMKLETMLGDW